MVSPSQKGSVKTSWFQSMSMSQIFLVHCPQNEPWSFYCCWQVLFTKKNWLKGGYNRDPSQCPHHKVVLFAKNHKKVKQKEQTTNQQSNKTTKQCSVCVAHHQKKSMRKDSFIFHNQNNELNQTQSKVSFFSFFFLLLCFVLFCYVLFFLLCCLFLFLFLFLWTKWHLRCKENNKIACAFCNTLFFVPLFSCTLFFAPLFFAPLFFAPLFFATNESVVKQQKLFTVIDDEHDLVLFVESFDIFLFLVRFCCDSLLEVGWSN